MGGSKKQTVGYKYFLGMHTVLAEKLDAILALKWSDRTGWAGTVRSGQIKVSAADLFGGEEREGGVSGVIDFLPGDADQTANDYLQSRLGAVIPAFRNVASLVFRQFYFGNNPYLKPLAIKASGIHCHGNDWYPAKAEIGGLFEIQNAALYIACDASLSMNGAKIANLRSALSSFLTTLQSNNIVTDIKIVAFNADASQNIERFGTDSADYDDLIAFAQGITTAYGTSFSAGASLAADFFDDAEFQSTGNEVFDILLQGPLGDFIDRLGQMVGATGESDAPARRVVVFLTDGEPVPTSDAAVAAATLHAIANVEVYAFNIDLTDTTYTALLDNTPEDGVPVISGGDSDAILAALSSAFLSFVDMNPAHILRDALGRKLGYDRFGDTWTAAADQLYSEGFGLSFHWKTPSATEEFVSLVERHIDAVHYEDPTTGKIEIALVRDDYDVETLTTFDASNISEWGDVSWPQPEELPNQITVTYSKTDGTQGSVTIANIAAVQAAGRVVPETIDYSGITRHALAARVCLRDLASRTTSLAAGSFYATHIDPALHEGSAIIVDEPRLGLDAIVARITRIEESNGEDNRALVEFVQDKFALGSEGLVTDGGEAELPTNTALAPDIRLVEEAPYYWLVLEQGQSTIDDALTDEPDQGFLATTCENPEGRHQDYILTLDTGAGFSNVATGEFAPATTLAAPLSAAADVTTAYVLYDTSMTAVRAGTLVSIGGEVVRVDDMAYGDGVVEMTIGRGCIDTPPVAHITGEAVIFWQDYLSSDEVVYLATEEVDAKLRPRTGSDVLRLVDAATDTVIFASRAIRPYPVGKLQVEASYAYADILPEPATLTWAHRDRLFQTTTTPEDHDDASIGPEASVAYTVEVRAVLPIANIFARTDFFAHADVFTDADAGTLVRSEAVGTAVTWDYEEETDFFDVGVTDIFALPDVFGFVTGRALRAEFGVRVTRDGYDNWQTARIRARHLAAPFGLEAEAY